MYLQYMSDEELTRYAERISEWVNEEEKAEIAAEFERRRMGSAETTREARRRAEEIREARRQARRLVLEEQWRRNGCVQDSSGKWIVPDDLIWRSLPRGEDR